MEPAPIGKTVFAIGLLATLAWADAPVAEARPSIRIGATLSQTGAYAFPGQAQLRGSQLCIKHLNDKGGVLGRKLELLVHNDGSDPLTAVRLYEKLITGDRVDLVIGPFGGVIADPVADVTEKHKMPMVAPVAAPTSMYRKGRKFVFSMLAPGETILEGLLDLAAKRGLKTVALIYEDDLGGRAVIRGAIDLARKKGLQVISDRRLLSGDHRLHGDPDPGPGREP